MPLKRTSVVKKNPSGKKFIVNRAVSTGGVKGAIKDVVDILKAKKKRRKKK